MIQDYYGYEVVSRHSNHNCTMYRTEKSSQKLHASTSHRKSSSQSNFLKNSSINKSKGKKSKLSSCKSSHTSPQREYKYLLKTYFKYDDSIRNPAYTTARQNIQNHAIKAYIKLNNEQKSNKSNKSLQPKKSLPKQSVYKKKSILSTNGLISNKQLRNNSKKSIKFETNQKLETVYSLQKNSNVNHNKRRSQQNILSNGSQMVDSINVKQDKNKKHSSHKNISMVKQEQSITIVQLLTSNKSSNKKTKSSRINIHISSAEQNIINQMQENQEENDQQLNLISNIANDQILQVPLISKYATQNTNKVQNIQSSCELQQESLISKKKSSATSKLSKKSVTINDQSAKQASKDKIELRHSKTAKQLPIASRYSLSQSIKQWNQIQVMKMNKWKQTNNQELQDVIERIQLHLIVINSIAQFVEMVDTIYAENQLDWCKLSNFLVYKKFYLERIKIIDTLRGKQNCFILSELEISKQQISKYINVPEIIQRADDIELTNKDIWNSLELYFKQIKDQFRDNHLVNMDLFQDKYVRTIIGQINAQLQALLPKLQELSDQDQDEVEIIHLRSFKIMELAFLLSELQGRKVKKFQDELQDFEHYYEQNYPLYKQTILYFT